MEGCVNNRFETVASAAAEADQAAERANRAAEKMEGLQIPEIGQMISEIIEDEKGKNGGLRLWIRG